MVLFFAAAALTPTLFPGVVAHTVVLCAAGSALLLVVTTIAAAPLFSKLPLWAAVFLVSGCVGALVGGVVGDAVSALPAMRALRAALPWRY